MLLFVFDAFLLSSPLLWQLAVASWRHTIEKCISGKIGMTIYFNLCMINLGTTAHRKRSIVITICPTGNRQTRCFTFPLPSDSQDILKLWSYSSQPRNNRAGIRYRIGLSRTLISFTAESTIAAIVSSSWQSDYFGNWQFNPLITC